MLDRRALRARAQVVTCGVLLTIGCATTPPQQLGAIVRVESDRGVALAGAGILFEGRELGKSDAEGRLTLALSGPPGAQLALEVRCPSGHRAVRSTVTVTLRSLVDTERRPEYRAECRPELRTLVVAVRAQNAANVPVLHLGREIARTDAQGIAHALLRLHPEESIALELDTRARAHRALRPQRPGFALTMPDRDDVVLFDQPFAVEKRHARPRRVQRVPMPVRL